MFQPACDIYSKSDTNDCAIVAVAAATNKTHRSIAQRAKKMGRRKGWGTQRCISRQIVEDLGYELVDVTQHYKGRTIRTLLRELPKNGRHLVSTYRHLVAIVDDKVYGAKIDGLKRVQCIYRVRAK